MKKKFLLILICLMLAVLCACAQSDDEKSEEPKKEIPEFTPVTEVVEGRKDIYLITKVLDSNYWDVVVKGAAEAGEEFGCNVYYSGTYNEMDWQGQKGLLDKCIKQGADAIVLAPNDSIELAQDIEAIHEKGIPVILVDTTVNSDGYDICYMTDNLLAGNKAAEEMLNKLKKSGYSELENLSVGILVGSDTSQTINERLAGFYQYWTANAPSCWRIVSDIKNCNGDITLGGELVTSLLDENSDIRGLYATNNGPTKALAQTVTDLNRTDIVVVGYDYSDEIKSLIESSDYKASTILQRQYYMSYEGVESALQLIDGAEIETKFTDTGVVVVNRDNLNDPKVQEVLENN
ncbi:MAG: ABC transporter substrate-binding protein [Eubacterium sp.]|nr:ABC transporter substrate-binding protein [Eubacterium sp.]